MSDLRVLLIGGPPGAGKTSVARAAAARLGFGSLTGDDLVVTARSVTTPETHPGLHFTRGLGHTRYFTETPPEQLIQDALAREEAMWPAVTRVIRSHLHAKTPTVFDWWLLSPTRVAALGEEGLASVWLYVHPEVLEARERRNGEFLAESEDPEQMFANFMARSLWRNEFSASQARGLGMPVVAQTGYETVEDVVESVLELVGG